jgi:1,2-phenylacetyl-CoA epoxidase catalytic subunit
MDLSKSFARERKRLQLVNHGLKLLTLMERLKGKSEDIDNLEEVIDLDIDMERYQKDTLSKLKPQQVY